MNTDKIIILCGPSGVGKTSVVRAFCQKYGDKFAKCISCTTRKKREGETNNIDYYFLSRKEFEDKLKQGKFVEYNLFDNEYYGTLFSEIEKYYGKKNCVLIIDPFSVCRTRELDFFKNKKTTTFFLDADDDELRRRLKDRGESQSEIDRKLVRAKEERKNSLCCNYIVYVEDIDAMIDKIYNVLDKED